MRLLFAGKYMSNYADILAELSEATPVFRRYARALGAGVGLVVADGLVHSALQGLGARLRAREVTPNDAEAARIEAYKAITSLAAHKYQVASGPGPRHPPIVHGLAALDFTDRAVLLLVSLEGFGYAVAADIAGISRETVFMRLQRARLASELDSQLRRYRSS
jgi:RNA polymerase sigma-70 factor (ECF subfamily)